MVIAFPNLQVVLHFLEKKITQSGKCKENNKNEGKHASEYFQAYRSNVNTWGHHAICALWYAMHTFGYNSLHIKCIKTQSEQEYFIYHRDWKTDLNPTAQLVDQTL